MLSIFFDIGSTFTKAVAIDLNRDEIIGKAKSPSTVNEDVRIGIKKVLDDIYAQTGLKIDDFELKKASSSAAGGLKIVAVGLVPDLTAEAAKKAALGAGGKVLKTYSFELTESDIQEIESLKPDIIILAGGTDGGNRYYPLVNAKRLAKTSLSVPVIFAGNKDIRDEVKKIFEEEKKEIHITENVMPEYNVLNIKPVQEIIREIFLKRIIYAKGLDKAQSIIGQFVMPTPLAVLKSLEVFAKKYGESILIDIGGATTDVCSVSEGSPKKPGVVLKGLPEPFVKRTVEGDLGVRVSALFLLESIGKNSLEKFFNNVDHIEEKIKFLSENTSYLPQNDEDLYLDYVLSYFAAKIAVERHVGFLEVIYSPLGVIYFQHGKDLTEVKNVLATGGPLINNPYRKEILKACIYSKEDPFILKPKEPSFYLDKEYILYAVGLLSEFMEDRALNLLERYLLGVEANYEYKK
ncbi:MAG TPA: methylaspartate mutase accessory protein GlmL [Dictyoglomaceae bacterium]|nr:methylaspartate mutase accessory protein GlmL [Dictyoglomaceae bacterium]HOL38943.1 methylaspartate mutase accessory protein GlmL [Dictyoglomaceae bacterium]HOP94869.1 methylaspartate mutase accessory protein GlmL [Dictyoglomaceae bacterium]HPP15640.1 methylaspartate mutase accessory protein GlmL [Dictyoglomaceae bacterium]HPU43826.1 methylaspartate mutase accessory protein GlmL [Dictyoglomaceae bacterium]